MTLREQQGVPLPTRTVKRAAVDALSEERPQRSASRHHVGTQSGLHPEDRPYQTDAHDDARYQTRAPSSTRRYYPDDQDERGSAPGRVAPRRIVRVHPHGVVPTNAIPARRSRTQQEHPGQGVAPRRVRAVHRPHRRRFHWLVFVGLGLLIMLVGFLLLNLAITWWTTTQDDWHYGRPRTSHADAVVGHDDDASHPTHFIAVNLNRMVEVIEFPGGDPSKARVFVGPTLVGDRQDLSPITLLLKDVSGDGKPDLVICINDNRFVFVNDQGRFRPARPGEQFSL